MYVCVWVCVCGCVCVCVCVCVIFQTTRFIPGDVKRFKIDSAAFGVSRLHLKYRFSLFCAKRPLR